MHESNPGSILPENYRSIPRWQGQPEPDEQKVSTHSQIENEFNHGTAHELAIQDLRQAWEIPTEVLTRQYGDYLTIGAKVQDQIVDKIMFPRQAALMSVHHWLYFNNASDLPQNLAVARPQDNPGLNSYVTKIVNIETPLSPVDQQTLQRMFVITGFGEIADERDEIRTKAGIDDKLRNVVETSPQYMFLKSLEVNANDQTERPLTISEKQIVIAAAEAAIRLKYGMQPHDDFRTANDPSARRELNRRAYQIDDDTISIKNKPKSEVEVAREFFLNDLRRFRDEIDDEYYNDFDLSPGKLGYFDDHLLKDYCMSLNERLGGGASDFFDGVELLNRYIGNLFTKSAIELSRCLEFAIPHMSAYSVNERNISPEAMIRLRGGKLKLVTGLKIDSDSKPVEFFDFPEEYAPYQAAAISSYEESEVERQHVMMTVEKRTMSSNEPPMRLISDLGIFHAHDDMFTDEETTLAREPEADLILEFATGYTKPLDVEGYNLLARDKTKNYYQKNNQPDPYRLADVVISSEKIDKISQHFKQIGMTPIVKALKKHPTTVQELVDLIYANSDYSYDTSINDSPVMPGVGIKNGRLQTQCDGAASILCQALNTAFSNSASIVCGLTLKPDSQIVTAVAHAQVLFTSEAGERFMLDATPAVASEGRLQGPVSNRTARLKKIGRLLSRPAKAAKADAPTVDTKEAVTKEPLPKEPPTLVEIEPKAISLKEQVEIQLSSLLKVTTLDELYEKTMKLPDADPVRWTLQLVLMANRGRDVVDEANRLHGYIANLKTADDILLKKIKISRYQSDTLQMLQGFVQQLGALQKV